jgi:hypothetical protein
MTLFQGYLPLQMNKDLIEHANFFLFYTSQLSYGLDVYVPQFKFVNPQ